MYKNVKELVGAKEHLGATLGMSSKLVEQIVLGRARLNVAHMRPKDWKRNPKTGLLEPDYRWIETQVGRTVDPESAILLGEDEGYNLITNVGRQFLHLQGYGDDSLGANGLNYIALSNDTVGETAASTTLSNEIATNGLERTQGVVVLPTGSGTDTTIANTFTASGSQSAQKAALFTASSVGIMNHVLAFTQRNLVTSDTLAVTFTITLGAVA